MIFCLLPARCAYSGVLDGGYWSLSVVPFVSLYFTDGAVMITDLFYGWLFRMLMLERIDPIRLTFDCTMCIQWKGVIVDADDRN